MQATEKRLESVSHESACVADAIRYRYLRSGEGSFFMTFIAPHFTIAAPVDHLIEGHQMPAYDNAIDECARPVFDAIRREMLEQVARIDALQFKTPTV